MDLHRKVGKSKYRKARNREKDHKSNIGGYNTIANLEKYKLSEENKTKWSEI